MPHYSFVMSHRQLSAREAGCGSAAGSTARQAPGSGSSRGYTRSVQATAAANPTPGPSNVQPGDQDHVDVPGLSQNVHVNPKFRQARQGPPVCNICSFKGQGEPRSVRHRHFSTRQHIELTVDEDGNFFCLSCKKKHEAFPSERVKLLMSDSTLHEFFSPPLSAQPPQPRPPGSAKQKQPEYEGDKVHTEYVTIPGAMVEQLQQAFRIEYGKSKVGIDVLLVAGLNNVLKGDRVEVIKDKIEFFRDTVMRQNYHHPDKPNTFAVATLLYPPQLCWYPDNGPIPSPATYTNRLDEMQWLNHELLEFNDNNRVVGVPHVHKFGVHIDNRTSKDKYGQVQVRHRVAHKWEQWREKDKRQMLHLDDKRRICLGLSINKYFRFNT